MINIRNAREIEQLRKSAQIVVEALKLIEARIQPGVKTGDLDLEIADFIYSKGARPAFKGFRGYPANSCISVDEQVVHGIPGPRLLKEGEIVSVDIGVELKGYYGDAAKTFKVGEVEPEKERLMQVTKESLELAVQAAVVGNRLSDIGHAVQTHVEAAGFSVVRDLVGHGLGTEMHEPPQIPNYGPPGKGPRLKPGMVFAIEPMVNMGSYEVYTEKDNWTVVTSDGKPSAHFEHDVVITNGKPEILTAGL
ncbi:type I methionyl aminopeptidase [candidate division KSB1 bacterium]|nr:type I methionyl aminopeptidase [candidate division KSB1 bacterium]RQW05827.1 MAG: type I methionyl aminopeptidase [candidate division KSB1 bacterium]